CPDIGSSKKQVRFFSEPKKGTFPCLNCSHCSSVIKGEYFVHPRSGKKFFVKDFYTCNSDFVVYILKCPCGLLYVGETIRPVKERIGEHKRSIRAALQHDAVEAPVPRHFKTCGHNVNQLRFQVIDRIPPLRRGGDRQKLLLQRETKWISTLETLSPLGLNEDYDLKHFL
ncbi:Hypothetical predicted protein, partial [Pelobates cultripes]